MAKTIPQYEYELAVDLTDMQALAQLGWRLVPITLPQGLSASGFLMERWTGEDVEITSPTKLREDITQAKAAKLDSQSQGVHA